LILNCCFLSDRIIDWGYQFLSSVIGLAAARSMAPMASYNSLITLTLWLAAKWANSDVITLPRASLYYLQSYLSPARFILTSYVSCGMADMQMVTYFAMISLGMNMTSGVGASSGFELAHSAILGIRLALLLHPT